MQTKNSIHPIGLKRDFCFTDDENKPLFIIRDVEPIISYNNNIFLDTEELHQWKIEHIWNGIDIAVTEEDILR